MLNIARYKKVLFSWSDNHLGLIFIIPAMVLLGLLIVYPLIFNINMSLHKVNMLNFKSSDWEFVGFKNYIDVFKDRTVLMSLFRTFVFMIITVVGQVILGMIGALTLNTKIKAKGFLQLVY